MQYLCTPRWDGLYFLDASIPDERLCIRCHESNRLTSRWKEALGGLYTSTDRFSFVSTVLLIAIFLADDVHFHRVFPIIILFSLPSIISKWHAKNLFSREIIANIFIYQRKFFLLEKRPQCAIVRLISFFFLFFFFTTTLSSIVTFILVVGAGEEALISA